jgi:hypothetical protein
VPNYMLLLYDDPSTWKKMSPEELQKVLQKFFAWREKLRTQKILVGSAKLRDEPGKVIRGKDHPRVTDGPYSETREVLGGYFTIEASNYDDAVQQCRDCPHLEYGGTIEVREVEPVPGMRT